MQVRVHFPIHGANHFPAGIVKVVHLSGVMPRSKGHYSVIVKDDHTGEQLKIGRYSWHRVILAYASMFMIDYPYESAYQILPLRSKKHR